MPKDPSKSAVPRPRSLRHWWWAGLAASLLGAAIVTSFRYGPRSSLPSGAPPVQRKDLALRDGRYVEPNTGRPFTGIMLELYPSGACRSRSVVSNGFLEGLSVGYYTNGLRQIEEHFRAGVSWGPRFKWYDDGSKLSEAEVVDGKLEGTFRRWHPNGALAEEVPLKGGLAHGLSRAFYPNGRRKAEARMHQGQLLERHYWPDSDLAVSRDTSQTAQPADLAKGPGPRG